MGTSWISRKGWDLRKGGFDLEMGGRPPYQLWVCNISIRVHGVIIDHFEKIVGLFAAPSKITPLYLVYLLKVHMKLNGRK